MTIQTRFFSRNHPPSSAKRGFDDSSSESGGEARFSFDSGQKDDSGGNAEKRADQRSHRRHRVELAVTFGSEHNFYGGFAENLSAGGIFVATHQSREVGETFDLSIELPDCEQPVTGVGEVRWVREVRGENDDADVSPGMGIRFLTLDEGGSEAIEAFIEGRDPLFFDDDVLS